VGSDFLSTYLETSLKHLKHSSAIPGKTRNLSERLSRDGSRFAQGSFPEEASFLWGRRRGCWGNCVKRLRINNERDLLWGYLSALFDYVCLETSPLRRPTEMVCVGYLHELKGTVCILSSKKHCTVTLFTYSVILQRTLFTLSSLRGADGAVLSLSSDGECPSLCFSSNLWLLLCLFLILAFLLYCLIQRERRGLCVS